MNNNQYRVNNETQKTQGEDGGQNGGRTKTRADGETRGCWKNGNNETSAVLKRTTPLLSNYVGGNEGSKAKGQGQGFAEHC